MIRTPPSETRVTLMLQDGNGQPWPLYLSVDCVRFVGRYRRVAEFGPPSGLLHFLPGRIA